MIGGALLHPGWAGELDNDELAYIKSALQRSNKLRTAWGFPRGERRLTKAGITAVALWGREDDKGHNAELVLQARNIASDDALGQFPDTERKLRPVAGTSGAPGGLYMVIFTWGMIRFPQGPGYATKCHER